MLSEHPQVDARISERTPPDPRYQGSEDGCREYFGGDQQGHALWNLFAICKYAAAKKGARQHGKRPDDLRRASETLRDALEQCWRAGFKSDQLAIDMLRLMQLPAVAVKDDGNARSKICPACGAAITD